MNPIARLGCLLAACSVFAIACGGGDDPLFAPPPGSAGNAGSGAASGKGGTSGTGGIGGNAATAGTGAASGTGGSLAGGSAGLGGTPAAGGSAGASGTGANSSGGSSTGGTAGTAGCPNGCIDAIACTIDSCVQGNCMHAPGDCPAGQFCDVTTGCVPAPICSTQSQCTSLWGSDACKTNVHCDGATATCKFDVLDKDMDDHAPVVCGGDDCDDADAQRNPALPEICDGKDNDCDGSVDETVTCPGLLVCQSGGCLCPAANQCGALCVDKTSDENHCGACSTSCPAAASCINSSCDCPGSEIVCGSNCVDAQNNPQNCGSCGQACGQYSTCVSGACSCTKTQCGGQCVDAQSDVFNCGGCGVACPFSASCQAGSCVCPAPVPASCNGVCVDTNTDKNNCGSCGNQCTLGPCQSGVCSTCQPGGMLILLDQSGSMSTALGTGTRFTAMRDAVQTFVQEPASAGLSVGVNYYPRVSTNTLCLTSDYANPTVSIAALPGNATAILNGMTGKTPNGNSVFSPVIEAAISIVRGWQVAHPGRPGVVVTINDGGMGIGCTTDTDAWATTAATAGYTGTPSVVTSIIGIGSPDSQEIQTWNSTASAGGGTSQNTALQGSQAVLNALHTIRAGYVCP